jgi:hypothetical protein
MCKLLEDHKVFVFDISLPRCDIEVMRKADAGVAGRRGVFWWHIGA